MACGLFHKDGVPFFIYCVTHTDPAEGYVIRHFLHLAFVRSLVRYVRFKLFSPSQTLNIAR